ncbi:helix-turn-helix transcriptional regulator [Aeromonas hydrophila]|uniref:Helix-turn-helix domain-containing protein n=2 Tax=Aeromonas TaxID=642 RepID=A0ABW0YFY1_9GAMM|nr:MULTISPECIES: helix-turn-helix transcriptional regulator [Aeromonas]MBW3832041.1 helix-turn-helix domain-containing protein [Aeromonas hydrophila]MBW5264032.1 helix-turn-helix domain-containing protein [Aeromonas hydrophila]MBW5276639.1 helix-turn-helix domain-containing protein [Aeromonas hydrophila]MCA4697980.1 helix-turn-helix transcriptional regulator [Aeromonas hydrophila]MCX4103498.1 helix-turn-helix transcriptional regulator [Aeromonas hydrophila]
MKPSFNERVRARMEEQGLGVSEIARRAGISKSLVSNLLSNPLKDVRVSTLFGLAKALSVDPIELYTGRPSIEVVSDLVNSVYRIPVFTIDEVLQHPTDSLPLVSSDRMLLTDMPGALIGVEAPNDQLSKQGIVQGDVCVIDLGVNTIEADAVLLVQLSRANQAKLLRAIPAIEGWAFGVDDERLPVISAKDVIILGRMVERRG